MTTEALISHIIKNKNSPCFATIISDAAYHTRVWLDWKDPAFITAFEEQLRLLLGHGPSENKKYLITSAFAFIKRV